MEFQVVLNVKQNLPFFFLKLFAQEIKKKRLSYITLPPPTAFWKVFIPYSHLRLEKLKETEMEEFQITLSFRSMIQEDMSEITLAGTLPTLGFPSVTCSVTQCF